MNKKYILESWMINPPCPNVIHFDNGNELIICIGFSNKIVTFKQAEAICDLLNNWEEIK